MFGVDDAVIGAGVGLLGGLFQNSAAAANQKSQQKFEERMRSTQYQTAVTDMKAAGLNPMLAYSQGGAGTPNVGAAPVVNVGDSIARGMQSTVNSGKTAATLAPAIENLKADTSSKLASASAAAASAKNSNVNSALTAALTPNLIQKGWNDAELGKSALIQASPKNARSTIEDDYLQSAAGKALVMSALAGHDVNSATSGLKNFGSLVNDSFKALGM